MKKRVLLVIIFFASFIVNGIGQQFNALKTFRVAIFSALYLDSVFTNNEYNYGNKFPKFAQQGLDFAQGAEIALDSLPLPNGNIIASFFDSKATTDDIPSLISNHKLDSMDLIIGSVKDVDFLNLTKYAKQKNIPFISATYPNDGGITNNPFTVIINPTLKAHCETIYSYLLQTHGMDNIFLCRKKGSQEDKIAQYLKAINGTDGKPLLNIQTLNFEDDFSKLKSSLDSNRKTILIGGSLNEDFVFGLVTAAYEIKDSYKMEIIGMPNWDAFAKLKKPSLKNLPFYYTTAFINNKTNSYTKKIQQVYLKKFKGVPSDMTYKGFESIFIFARLITRYPDDFMSHLNEYAYKVFNDYNFKAVYSNNRTKIPDYFENKRLYFMKILNGKTSKAW